jgi:hypothetical protein
VSDRIEAKGDVVVGCLAARSYSEDGCGAGDAEIVCHVNTLHLDRVDDDGNRRSTKNGTKLGPFAVGVLNKATGDCWTILLPRRRRSIW